METLLFAVIIGIISAIFSKKKEEASGRKGFWAFISRMKELLDPEQKTTQYQAQKSPAPAPSAAPWQDSTLLRSIENEYNEKKKEAYKKKQANSLNEIKQENDQNRPAQLASKYEETIKSPELEVGEQSLVRAVIWSEILGPPRSKSPYLVNRNKS